MTELSARAQADRARQSSALAPVVPARVSRVLGADAIALFDRLSTQDLRPLQGGRQSVTTLFLSPAGRLLHRVLLQPAGEGLRAVHVSAPEQDFAAWIDRYTFAEDCRVESSDMGAALLVGPEALQRAGLEKLGDTASRGELLLSARAFGPLPSVVASGPREELDRWASELDPEGVAALDESGLQQLRLECGVVSAGAELTEDYHVLESGLKPDVSFTKGCYTGQEIVARQDSYDKVVRRLVGLVFEGRPEPGEALASENKAGCVVTSVAPEAPGGLPGGWPEGPACLGFVRSKTFEEGASVQTESGLDGRMLALPFPAYR